MNFVSGLKNGNQGKEDRHIRMYSNSEIKLASDNMKSIPKVQTVTWGDKLWVGIYNSTFVILC